MLNSTLLFIISFTSILFKYFVVVVVGLVIQVKFIINLFILLFSTLLFFCFILFLFC